MGWPGDWLHKVARLQTNTLSALALVSACYVNTPTGLGRAKQLPYVQGRVKRELLRAELGFACTS